MQPFQILGVWIRGVLALLFLSTGIYLLKVWSEGPSRVPTVWRSELSAAGNAAADAERRNERRTDDVRIATREPGFGLNRDTAFLVSGLVMLLVSLGGSAIFPTLRSLRRERDLPGELPPGTVLKVSRPDGTELHIQAYGPPDGIPVILTHGWGLDRNEWIYAHRELAPRCRIIVWDLPGLGLSKGPKDNDLSLEKLARDLRAVVTLAGEPPVVLAGHSVGGMIILTYCRLFAAELKDSVAAIVVANSTYTNPVQTTSKAWLYRPLQKPVLEPLCHLMIWLSPVVWLMNWLSYLNGSAHLSNHRSFFSGKESREQLDFIARYSVECWPATIARGLLAMFRYDATSILETLPIPALIVVGNRDATCTPDAGERMAHSIPDANCHELFEARHGGPFEFHSEFAAALNRMIGLHSRSIETGRVKEIVAR